MMVDRLTVMVDSNRLIVMVTTVVNDCWLTMMLDS